jgi:succinate-semialdehyde dehydrogenase / glutarate-semialdehyde dehydrogenase
MTFFTVDPFTQRPIEEFAPLTDDALIECLSRASAAFLGWRATPVERRAELCQRLADLLRSRTEGYAGQITREMGKPIREARAEIVKCAWVCDYYAQNAPKFLADVPVNADGERSWLRSEPLGTVLGIMPWNFPFWQTFRFAAPALMAGNVVLLKPAPNTTRCGLALAQLLETAGFPPGVFQTIVADNEQIRHVIGSPYVQAVTLTGSERAGVAVASTAGASLKKTVLELGGSDPFIVLADADVNRAAEVAVQARMVNAGQSCVAAKRFIVHQAVADKFLHLCQAAMERLVMGDPTLDTTDLGPLARPDLVEKIYQQVQRSLQKGATLVLGHQPSGNFYPPTLLTQVRPGMPVFDEETFGPVMAVSVVPTDEAALELANASDYGLGASLWTQDPAKAEKMAAQLAVGMVFVNAMVKSDPRLPFGGIKKSGYGRELSHHGLAEFTNLKTIFFG